MTTPTNYVDLVSANYPKQHRCRRCGLVLRRVGDTWIDGAGRYHCGVGAHSPRPITPSSLTRSI